MKNNLWIHITTAFTYWLRAVVRFLRAHRAEFKDIALALLIIVLTTATIEMIGAMFPGAIGPHNRNKSAIYLFAIALVSGYLGLWPGLIAAIASFFIFSYLYTYDVHNFENNINSYALNLLLFVAAAFLIAIIIGSWRRKIDALNAQNHQLQSFIKLEHSIASVLTPSDLLSNIEYQLTQIIGSPAHLILKQFGYTAVESSKEYGWNVGAHEAFSAAVNINQPAGYISGNDQCQGWQFQPMQTSSGAVGILALHFNTAFEYIENYQSATYAKMLTSLAGYIASLLEKKHLQLHSLEQGRQLETEQLRSTLLSSISHDLKTPLASVMGCMKLLQQQRAVLPEKDIDELFGTSIAEAERLHHFINNVLELSKLETGAINLKPSWINVYVLANGVVDSIKHTPISNTIEIDKNASPFVEILGEYTLLWKVFQNLLENAVAHTSGNISITWSTHADGFMCNINDTGPGIDEGILSKIFEKHTHFEKRDYQRPHSGLGLSIARAIMNIHGGRIWAENIPSGGAAFIFTLPHCRIHSDEG